MKVKKICLILLYLIYLIGVTILIDYLFFIRHRANLPALKNFASEFSRFPDVDRFTILRIGEMQGHAIKMSSFTHFEPQKREGIIRIGCFGDSFTFGREVNYFNDYPSMLQKMFNEAGFGNIEVLNFGVAGYGFHQTYIFWENVGKKYGLDYVLLGPDGCFFWHRDSSFCSPGEIFPSHSRYIVRNSKLELIDPVGDTPLERAWHFRRFIPYYRYLRYEKMAPMFLQCLIPEGREFRKNPFYYYKGSLEEEAYEIYKGLLSHLADTGVQIILLHSDPDIISVGKSLNRVNLKSFPSFRLEDNFLYETAGGHWGPSGNQAIAQQMFDILTNRIEKNLEMVRCFDLEENTSREPVIDSMLELYKYDETGIEINGVVLGRFVKPGESFLWKTSGHLKE